MMNSTLTYTIGELLVPGANKIGKPMSGAVRARMSKKFRHSMTTCKPLEVFKKSDKKDVKTA